jgi:hypothetical protein
MNKKIILSLMFFFVMINKTYACDEMNMKEYKKVSFETLLSAPSAFDKQLIEVKGIYSGLRKFGPVLYKDNKDFKFSNYRRGIFILNQNGSSVFVNVKHGKPVVVRGKLRLPQKNEASVYYAEIIEVCSVEGVSLNSRPTESADESKGANKPHGNE